MIQLGLKAEGALLASVCFPARVPPSHQVPIYARAIDLAHLNELRAAGAEDVVLETAEVRG